MPIPSPAGSRRQRLVDEVAEQGLVLDGTHPAHDLILDELDYALRPPVHERRVPSYGAIVAPGTAPWAWQEVTGLRIERRPIDPEVARASRGYADGISSWLLRWDAEHDEGLIFDRPAGSERDLVVLAQALGATVVQRHPSGTVRVVGPDGVFRFDGLWWHHEPMVASWIDAVGAGTGSEDRQVLERLLQFAVHDLGSDGVGAILVFRPDRDLPTSFERRLPTPPPLRIGHPPDLAPLRHVLAQIDGATLFAADGTLREIGVRLVPTTAAEAGVEGYRGMRHTAGRRYSYDDPTAAVIVVREDGPVTVLRGGELIAATSSGGPTPGP
ncbi:hypothetical protein BH24ACT4_BH24ACT4_25380 [soil metagenome]